MFFGAGVPFKDEHSAVVFGKWKIILKQAEQIIWT
jgi:hypothetical protein